MADDFSKAAITDRLMHAAEVYANAGNQDGLAAVSQALQGVANAGSDADAREVEIQFNLGTFGLGDNVDEDPGNVFDLSDPDVQLPGDTGDIAAGKDDAVGDGSESGDGGPDGSDHDLPEHDHGGEGDDEQ